MSSAPKVFVSYSHDSPEHRRWVADLASRLCDSGVDVLLDQWELGLGADVPKFMERAIAEADRVLVVCTEAYVRKADAGRGGVGYEAMIVTSELVRDLGSNKFIPVIRQASGALVPTVLSTRLFVDFSDSDDFEDKLEELLRELHQIPAVPKPKLGRNPFQNRPNMRETADADGIDSAAVYRAASALAREGDALGWRKNLQRIRRRTRVAVDDRFSAAHSPASRDENDLARLVESGTAPFASLVACAAAGLESGHAMFRNQSALVEDILYRRDRPRGGSDVIQSMPFAALFLFQAVNGAVALDTGQLREAIHVAHSKIESPGGKERRLFEVGEAVGWPKSLGGNAGVSWSYLKELPNRWPWLREVFDSDETFWVSVNAYYLLLSIAELVDLLAAGRDSSLENVKDLWLDVPACFAGEGEAIQRRSARLLVQHAEQVASTWRGSRIDDARMRESWALWSKAFIPWHRRAHGGWTIGDARPFADLVAAVSRAAGP